MRAFITGVTGQDGSYLAELLLSKGYDVYGLVRRTSFPPKVVPGVKVLEGDVTDLASLADAINEADPTEVYNLAAQSFVGTSFGSPLVTAQINGIGALNLFDLCARSKRQIRVYQAGTSELFGGVSAEPADELTPFHPRSPYASAKAFAHYSAVNYRESYGLHVSNGILFNHESPRRGEQFVTRKITRAVGRIVAGTQQTLTLGDLNPQRDWGFAGDYVEAMWLMLQQDTPDDYVIGTGETRSVRDFLNCAFACVGLDPGPFVLHDREMQRPAEVGTLLANPAKAELKLGWKARTPFGALVEKMVAADCELAAKEKRA